MKKIFLSSAIFSIMLVGCQNEDLVQQSAQQNYSLKVSMDTKSRTYIDGETGKCLWGEDEKIFVTSKDGKTTGILSLSSKSEDGTSAIFSGVVMGNPSTLYYSVYPVPDNNGEIDITAINGANHNAPMHGVIDIQNGTTEFDYACGLICMKISGVDKMSINVVPNDGTTQLAGGTYSFNAATGTWNHIPGSGITVMLPANDVVYIPVNAPTTETLVTVSATLPGVASPSIFTTNVKEDAIATNNVPNIEVEDGEATQIMKWDGETITTTWYDNASANTTFSITEAAELAGLAKLVNEGTVFRGKTIVIEKNIDLNNHDWTPIGNSAKPFEGTFDGQNHTISNLFVDGGSQSNNGLFGYTTNGEIRNLTVNNAKVSGRLNVGVVAGTPYTSKYTNIIVTGHIEVDGMAYVGGVGGKNAYADWTNITVNVDKTSYVNANSVENGTAYRTYVGGVVGFNGEGGHSFINITSNINVKGSTIDVGGLFGIAHYGNKFENCVCTGNVEIYAAEDAADAQEIGGIAGVWHNETGTKVIFTNCSFTGELKANNGYIINTNKFGNLVCAAYGNGSGILVINDEEYVKVNNDYVTIGSIVTVGEHKVVVYSASKDEVKGVSVEEFNLNGKNYSDATTWATGLGEGWSLASIEELDVIHTVREILNVALAAENADNALFCEKEYYNDGKYALYLSSTDATGKDPKGEAYFTNRVHVKYFNLNGYWDYPRSTFATISKYAPLKDNYFARAVYTF